MMQNCIYFTGVAVALASSEPELPDENTFWQKRTENYSGGQGTPAPELPDETTYWRKFFEHNAGGGGQGTPAPELPDETTYWRNRALYNAGGVTPSPVVFGNLYRMEQAAGGDAGGTTSEYEIPDENEYWNKWSSVNQNGGAGSEAEVPDENDYWHKWSIMNQNGGMQNAGGDGAEIPDENDYWRKWSAANYDGGMKNTDGNDGGLLWFPGPNYSSTGSSQYGRRRLDGEESEFASVEGDALSFAVREWLTDEEVAKFAEEALEVYENTSEDMSVTFNELHGVNPWHDATFMVMMLQEEQGAEMPDDPVKALAEIFRSGVADPVAHFRECERYLLEHYLQHVVETDPAGVSSDGVHYDAAGVPIEAGPAGEYPEYDVEPYLPPSLTYEGETGPEGAYPEYDSEPSPPPTFPIYDGENGPEGEYPEYDAEPSPKPTFPYFEEETGSPAGKQPVYYSIPTPAPVHLENDETGPAGEQPEFDEETGPGGEFPEQQDSDEDKEIHTAFHSEIEDPAGLHVVIDYEHDESAGSSSDGTRRLEVDSAGVPSDGVASSDCRDAAGVPCDGVDPSGGADAGCVDAAGVPCDGVADPDDLDTGCVDAAGVPCDGGNDCVDAAGVPCDGVDRDDEVDSAGARSDGTVGRRLLAAESA